MSVDVTRLDLRLRRRSLAGYAIGMIAYALVIVALYPTFKDDHSLDAFTEKSSTVAALFGASGPLTTPSGWLNANLYGNFVPLVALLLAIGYGAAAVAGQNEDGTLGLVVGLPLSRRRVLGEKLATLCLQPVPTAITTAAAVAAGRAFQLSVGTGRLIGITVATILLGVVFGEIALLAGIVTGARAVALGLSSCLAAAMYLISSLAAVVDWIHPARIVSPFYWAVGNGQLAHGVSLTGWVVLGGLAVVLAALSLAAIERLDVR